mmetsp:Transcript_42514/g.51625  ORF Transcript_42514/g.51625 Transcript_42514/m.51625 type:complete len:232 (+) Transcript_42514:1943-2638(+)
MGSHMGSSYPHSTNPDSTKCSGPHLQATSYHISLPPMHYNSSRSHQSKECGLHMGSHQRMGSLHWSLYTHIHTYNPSPSPHHSHKSSTSNRDPPQSMTSVPVGMTPAHNTSFRSTSHQRGSSWATLPRSYCCPTLHTRPPHSCQGTETHRCREPCGRGNHGCSCICIRPTRGKRRPPQQSLCSPSPPCCIHRTRSTTPGSWSFELQFRRTCPRSTSTGSTNLQMFQTPATF